MFPIHLRTSVTTLLAGVVLSGLAESQIRQPGIPASEMHVLPADVPTVVMIQPDIELMKIEDEARQHRPLRYGAVISTDLGTSESGRWDDVPDTDLRVWRIKIVSPGAHTIGIVFDRFRIPEGGQVFLYDEGRREVLGAYTDKNNNVNDLLGIEPLTGDTVVIEYVHPNRRAPEPMLGVGEIIHDYRDLRRLELWNISGSSQQGTSCLIDINCPEGDNHQDVKEAVVRTLASGALCSGAILNNTAQDEIPYMLTANHCGNMTSGVFLFNYENSACGGGSASGAHTLSGAQLMTASSTYDSQLYRLNSHIPSNYNPYYAGWDRSNSTGSPAVSIGHGGGGPKQIAIDNNGASASGWSFSVFWHAGTLIGGNSGGPLFNGSKRVIGPACCVTNFDCGQQTAYYGRFSLFWTNNSLAQWLDPTGSNASFVDGLDPDGGGGGSTCSVGTTQTADIGSNGQQAVIYATGTPSVGSSDFSVNAILFKNNVTGVMWSGEGQGNNVQSWGTIYIAGPNFLRTYVSTNIAGACAIAVPVDASLVGITRYYQYAARDPDGPVGDRVQHTARLEVNFCP